MNESVQTAVCKSLQSLGMSPRKEHQIENALALQLESSGPEFVLSRLSDLKDWRKMHMKGEVSYHPDWHAYKTSDGCCRPSDRIGSQLWPLSDKAFFACLGAIQKSVELSVPTEKQLTKWLDGVRCENKSSNRYRVPPINERELNFIEKTITLEWRNRPWFNVSDITGTCIPGSGKQINVKVRSDNTKEELSLVSAYGFSISTAPLFTWQFLKDIDYASMSVDKEMTDSVNELISNKLEDNRLQDEAIQGSTFLSEEVYLAQRKYCNPAMGFSHSVGNIGFLQQSGGKLRTVANPNRFVQWCNVPLGKAFARHMNGISESHVRCQTRGMEWAQEKLRQRVSLSSFDMSSATDRLDYSKYLHEAFKKVYQNPDRFPMLARSLELFEDTSSSPWSIPGHISDLCNIPGCEISWSVGQPLGLRPSFPLLTMMNCAFARQAIREVDGKFSHGHYACVGDDLIIETKYADRYMDIVTCYNGKINNEKTIVSDRFAEFCSHMITRSEIYPLKPRFILDLDGCLSNIEKFSTKGIRPKVPKWAKDLYDSIAAWSIPGFTKIPYSVTSSPRTLMERAGVATLIETINSGERDRQSVSLQTLYLRAKEQSFARKVCAKQLDTSYADDAYPAFGGSTNNPHVEMRLDGVNLRNQLDVMGSVSSDKSTSVDLPTITEWDYRKDQYVTKHSSISSARKLRDLIDNVEITAEDGELVECGFRSKSNLDEETLILLDLKSRPSQAIYSVKRKGIPEYVGTISVNSAVERALAQSSAHQLINTHMLTDEDEEDDSFEL